MHNVTNNTLIQSTKHILWCICIFAHLFVCTMWKLTLQLFTYFWHFNAGCITIYRRFHPLFTNIVLWETLICNVTKMYKIRENLHRFIISRFYVLHLQKKRHMVSCTSFYYDVHISNFYNIGNGYNICDIHNGLWWFYIPTRWGKQILIPDNTRPFKLLLNYLC